jgi:hypothetical protein
MSQVRLDPECHRCGGENSEWSTPSPLWNLVMRGGSINGESLYGDMVCVGCFVLQATLIAGVSGHWRLTVTPEPPGLETVTPSGRTWNPETWLWDEATS